MNLMARPETTTRDPADTPAVARPNLMTVADAKALDVVRMTDLFKAHINPASCTS